MLNNFDRLYTVKTPKYFILPDSTLKEKKGAFKFYFLVIVVSKKSTTMPTCCLLSQWLLYADIVSV